MFSRLTQGVTSVLQELSGEEHHVDDADAQDGLVPHSFSGPDAFSDVSGPSEEILERLAQTEQLVVHLKELIREKDNQLACSEKKLKEEKEQGDAKFTKLKLQAKAKMAVLNKQIAELKGQEGLNTSQSSESSFLIPSCLEEEIHNLKEKLSQEKSSNQSLQEQLRVLEERIKEREVAHTEQVRILQAVVKNKDMRFQEQIQKHEEELVQVKTQAFNDADLQQALRDSQRRIEELEESLRSRSEVLDMLQQELNSADQQKQILTAQFGQMKQQLEGAQELREQEKQQLALHAEEQLQALRSNLEALEKEKERIITTLETELSQKTSELDRVKASQDESVGKGQEEDLKLSTLRANLKASEKQRKELMKNLEVEVERRSADLHQLQEKFDAVEKEKEEALQRESEATTRLQMELMSLKEMLAEQKAGVQAKQALETLWKRLYSLSSEEFKVETDVPEDPEQILCALETRLDNLRAEHRKREVQMSQVSDTIETLQGQLDKSTMEGEQAAARIQHLEQQLTLHQVTDEPQEGQVTDHLVGDLDKAKAKFEDKTSSEKIVMLEQQLVEQKRELAALREHLTFTELHNLKISQDENSDLQNNKNTPITHDCSEVLPGLVDISEEDATLVAVGTETTSVLSLSANNESSPDTTGPQAESPLEFKGTSSDEMVTSTDSEVVHSSWTLLEAFNQDSCQEWPQQIQDLNAFHLSTQSWEETSEESSSMVVQKSVEIQISQQDLNVQNADSSSGQAFAQILAEELQKKYNELLSDLQQMKYSVAESQEKVHLLEEELSSLTVVKDEAESRALRYERELVEAQANIHQVEEQMTSDIYIQKKVLEEQLESMHEKANFKDQKICLLQADLEEIQQKLTKKEGQAQRLRSQLEDRELVSSELEEKVLIMEARIQQISEEAEKTKSALLGKSSELGDLQQCLFLKEQEMIELSNCMTAKLCQVGEERFKLSSEVKMLKEQIMELKKTWDEQQKVKTDQSSEDLVALQKENENLIAQVATMKTEGEKFKRKLQAALVQRKQLMKKIGGITREEESWKANPEGDVTSGDKGQDQELQKLESQLQETKRVLRSKQEALNVWNRQLYPKIKH
ncbi:Golgin subfamily B member 1 [Bagarius yarrelli]|uniref:Golgin subfamily B member 1 n=1 Tax=Bagarius yarrelli TaxID=175774 RepID=A0A556VLF5_BAGYA|nr:Golgin subfamily B member 1 [Bagarius yarrelli]